jgi:hypothetical protein
MMICKFIFNDQLLWLDVSLRTLSETLYELLSYSAAAVIRLLVFGFGPIHRHRFSTGNKNNSIVVGNTAVA